MKVRNKYLLIMAAVWGPCLGLAAASYAVVLRPQMDERRALEEKISKARQLYAKSVDAAKPESRARLNERVGRLNDRIADFLVGFDDAAEATGVPLDAQRPSGPGAEFRVGGPTLTAVVASESSDPNLPAPENASADPTNPETARLATLSDLAFRIGSLAHETRLESFGMKPAANRASKALPHTEHLSERRISVSFLGGFTRFAAFLNALERHHPVVFVETFAISRATEADAEPRVNMELAVLVEKPRGD